MGGGKRIRRLEISETGEELIRAMFSLDVSVMVIHFGIIVIALFFG